MNELNYLDLIIQKSQAELSLMKEKMLEPIKQIQNSRQESLKNLLIEIEQKQKLLLEKKLNLEKICPK